MPQHSTSSLFLQIAVVIRPHKAIESPDQGANPCMTPMVLNRKQHAHTRTIHASNNQIRKTMTDRKPEYLYLEPAEAIPRLINGINPEPINRTTKCKTLSILLSGASSSCVY